MSKLEFKEFVKKNPNLIDYVDKGETNWQKLYELYDLYGENSDVWEKYKVVDKKVESTSGNGFKDLLNLVKGVDLTAVQKGLNSLDKAIEAFKGLAPTGVASPVTEYEPRPTYKYFED